MKRILLSFFVLVGLVVSSSVYAQSNLSNAFTDGFTPEEMESLYKALTPSNQKSYLKDKGYKYNKIEDGVYYYDKNDVVRLAVAFADNRIVVLGFSSSAQKYYQATALLDKTYKKLIDVKMDGVAYKQWKKGELIYRGDVDSNTILLSKETDL